MPITATYLRKTSSVLEPDYVRIYYELKLLFFVRQRSILIPVVACLQPNYHWQTTIELPAVKPFTSRNYLGWQFEKEDGTAINRVHDKWGSHHWNETFKATLELGID